MSDELEKAIATLGNRDAGWVTRRDAAEFLGRSGAKAVEALHAHSKDADVDVQRTVKEALGWASAGLEGIEPAAAAHEYGLEELVRGLEKKGKRSVAPHGDGFEVRVELPKGRSQKVYIGPTKRRDGADLIRVFTRCGKPAEDTLHWALRTNMSMAQCALALIDEDGEEEFVLVNCFLTGEVTPRELKSAVNEIAFYGDWVEQRLTGVDES